MTDKYKTREATPEEEAELRSGRRDREIRKHYEAGYREGLLKRAYRQGYEAALNGEELVR